MPAFVTLYDESIDPTNRDFYAPGFELRIDGVGLPRGVLRDVMEVTYHDDINEIDGFELTVNNWDATTRACKYIGSETTADLSGGSKASQLFSLFDPGGKSAELAIGYSGDFQSMVRATFTTMEPSFPESGPPVLTVRGSNILKALRTKQFTGAWTNRTPSAIALNFNSLRSGSQPRLPSPWKVVTDGQAAAAESSVEYVAQKNQYDVDFLLQLAHGQGYTLEANEDAQELYFGPSQSSTPTNYQLGWGKGLMSFKPSLATANQWKSVTVRGWDRADPEADRRHGRSGRPAGEEAEQRPFEPCPGPAGAEVVDLPVFTAAEAKQRALAIMLDRSKEIVTAHGKTVGLPKLQGRHAGQHPGNRRATLGRLFRHQDNAHARRERLHHRVRLPQRGSRRRGGRIMMHGRMQGIVIGKVVNVHDPQNQGRVQVSFPWLDDSLQSTWASMVAPYAGADRGLFSCRRSATNSSSRSSTAISSTPTCLARCGTASRRRPRPIRAQRMICSTNGHKIRFVDSTAERRQHGRADRRGRAWQPDRHDQRRDAPDRPIDR